MRRRIVFLDFDGVLNSKRYLDRVTPLLTDADFLTRSPKLIAPEAVTRLNGLSIAVAVRRLRRGLACPCRKHI